MGGSDPNRSRHQIRVQENQLGQLVSEIPRPSPSTSLLLAPGDGRKTNEIRLKPAAAERGSRSRPFECTKPNDLCLYSRAHFTGIRARCPAHGCVAKILSWLMTKGAGSALHPLSARVA
jgi:hypothetical protein